MTDKSEWNAGSQTQATATAVLEPEWNAPAQARAPHAGAGSTLNAARHGSRRRRGAVAQGWNATRMAPLGSRLTLGLGESISYPLPPEGGAGNIASTPALSTPRLSITGPGVPGSPLVATGANSASWTALSSLLALGGVSGNTAWNLAAATAFTATLTGAITTFAPENVPSFRQSGLFRITQDATGGRQFTFAGAVWAGGEPPIPLTKDTTVTFAYWIIGGVIEMAMVGANS